MTPLETMASALRAKFEAYSTNAPEQYDSIEQLIGAAKLVGAVAAAQHGDSSLQELSRLVLDGVVERELQLEQEQQASYEYSDKRDALRRQAARESFQLVKNFVGKEHQNLNWQRLVSLYRAEFPTFEVRESVDIRLSPKEQATRLRKHLLARLSARKLGQSPSLTEMEDSLPDALADLAGDTFTYREKALPGFDFRSRMYKA